MTRDEVVEVMRSQRTITFAEMDEVANADGVLWAESVHAFDADFMGTSYPDAITSPQSAPTVEGTSITRPFR